MSWGIKAKCCFREMIKWSGNGSFSCGFFGNGCLPTLGCQLSARSNPNCLKTDRWIRSVAMKPGDCSLWSIAFILRKKKKLCMPSQDIDWFMRKPLRLLIISILLQNFIRRQEQYSHLKSYPMTGPIFDSSSAKPCTSLSPFPLKQITIS